MSITVNSSLIPSTADTPLDARTVIEAAADILNIQNPAEGLLVYAKDTKKYYKVKSLVTESVGAMTVYKVGTYEALPDKTELDGKAPANHTHAEYALTGHTHDALALMEDWHSIEMGFDNAPVTSTYDVTDENGQPVYEEDGVTPKTETDRAYGCIVVGSGNTYGSCVVIVGDGNENSLGFVRVYGSNNKTYQFQTISGDGNDFQSATYVTVYGNTNRGGDAAQGSIIVGDMNICNGRWSTMFGYRVTNNARGAKVFGRYYEVPDSPEYYYSFCIGSGQVVSGGKTEGEISFVHRVNKKMLNPLYNPTLDAGNTGTDSTGEKQYIAERAYSTEYRGHFLPVTKTTADTGVVTLDHDVYARWILTASGAVTLTLANWKDGDIGEIIVNTSNTSVTLPASWIIPEDFDITTTAGIYALELEQVGESVYCHVRCPFGGSGIGHGNEITISDAGTWVIDGVDTGKPSRGAAFTYADFTAEQLAALKGAKGDKGDPFVYSDFTAEQLAALKGDPFVYSDFTAEQLAALKVKGDKGDSSTNLPWYPLSYASTIALDVNNGAQQKIVLTGDCILTPPVLDASNTSLILQIESSGQQVAVGNDVIIDVAGIWMIGWFFDGGVTRRFQPQEVL